MPETDRLILRRWRPEDREAFAALNADVRVMEYFPKCLSREESDAFIGRVEQHFDAHGFGWWALEEKSTGAMIGFTGLSIPQFQAHFTPCVEIGWRLAHEAWGNGYASEAAREALRQGFLRFGAKEILSFTVPANVRSRRVMERIGMHRDPGGDFSHPRIAPDHPLSRHVLYRIARDEFLRPESSEKAETNGEDRLAQSES